jgi:hypothetical protein
MTTNAQQTLKGVIDVHAHCGPDSLPRTVDAIDLARLAKSEGMRGVVIKNHYEPTASAAYLARKVVPGIEVFGGITLNLPAGGMNPAAVANMARITGGYGRYVWMTSMDSEAQVQFFKEQRASVSISKDGQLRPETKQVVEVIAEYELILSTGHSTPEEVLLLVHEARKQGVERIVVTHAMMAPIHLSIPQMQELARLGAYIEFVYNGLIGRYKEFEFADYAEAVRAVGAESCILGSDLGQVANPVHTIGLKDFYAGMLEAGVTQDELDRMTKHNPAWLLKLDAQKPVKESL